MLRLTFICVFINLSWLCLGQTSTPKYSNEFLALGVGARGLALSGSQVAQVNDVTSGYWNPAGLNALTTKYEFSLMHAEYFAGIAKYDYLAFATQIDSVSTLGVSIIRFAIDDIPDTRFLYDANGAINYDNIRFFTAADYAFLISYARRLPILGGVRVGGNFKVIHRLAGDFANAWGFGLDIGGQMNYRKWQIGLMLKDITGTFNAWSHNTELVADVYAQTGNEIPSNSVEVTLPKAIIGVSRYFPIKSKFGVQPSIDLISTFDGKRNTLVKSGFYSFDPTIGIEINYMKKAFVRMGVGNIQQEKDFEGSKSYILQTNFGLGINLKKITVDYALTDIGDFSASVYSHVFSLKASLNGK